MFFKGNLGKAKQNKKTKITALILALSLCLGLLSGCGSDKVEETPEEETEEGEEEETEKEKPKRGRKKKNEENEEEENPEEEEEE